MRTRSSFTLIELIIVLIILGILAFSLNFNFFNNNLEVAADKLIRDIRFTQSLALKDDKYYPFPDNNTSYEYNKSKYWFKQWWQIKFIKSHGDYFYQIFSDSPDFDLSGGPVSEYALNPLNEKYIAGAYSSSTNAISEYNLSKYNIKLIDPYKDPYDRRQALRLVFDNLGNVFLEEGQSGDAGDINPLYKNKRHLLVHTLKIHLCLDNPCILTKDRCIQVNITPTGYAYKSTCN